MPGPVKHEWSMFAPLKVVFRSIFLTFRSPWEIIVAYLISIVCFAFIYSFFLARDFYHPYVKFEPVIQVERARLGRALDDAIASELDHSSDLGTSVKFELTQGAVVIRERRKLRRDRC